MLASGFLQPTRIAGRSSPPSADASARQARLKQRAASSYRSFRMPGRLRIPTSQDAWESVAHVDKCPTEGRMSAMHLARSHAIVAAAILAAGACTTDLAWSQHKTSGARIEMGVGHFNRDAKPFHYWD